MIGIASLRSRLERLGGTVTSQVWRLGFASRFLFYLMRHSGTALLRFRLTVAQVYFAGVLSLVIILVSPFVALFWLERTQGFARAARLVTRRRALTSLAKKRATAIEQLRRAQAAMDPGTVDAPGDTA